MSKEERLSTVKHILEYFASKYPSRQSEFDNFYTEYCRSSICVIETLPPYQQVICKIFEPNYSANNTNIEEVQSLIDKIEEDYIKKALQELLDRKANNDKERNELTGRTINDNAEKREKENAIFQQHITRSKQ